MSDTATATAPAAPPAPVVATEATTPGEEIDAASLRRMRLWALPGLAIVALSMLVAEAFLADWPPVDGFRLNVRIGMAAILHVQAVLLLMAIGLGARQGRGRLSDYAFALTLAPMSRVVSLALPGDLFDLDLYGRLMLVLFPLFVGLVALSHSRGLDAWGNGLRAPALRSVGGILWTVVIAFALPAAAYAQYLLVDPDLPDLTGDRGRLVFYSTILVLLALWQEMLFRGVLVRLGERVFGAQVAVLLSAFWFALLLVGTQAGLHGATAGAVGVGFLAAWIASQQAAATRSVVLTWLASSVALLLYFVVLPAVDA